MLYKKQNIVTSPTCQQFPNDSTRKVFLFLVWCRQTNVRLAQSTIARSLKLSRQTVNKALQWLIQNRVVSALCRFRDTSTYKLCVSKDSELVRRVKNWLLPVVFFSLLLLQPSEATLNNIKGCLLKSSSLTMPSTTRCARARDQEEHKGTRDFQKEEDDMADYIMRDASHVDNPYNFGPEQLEALSHYPKEAVMFARRRLTQVLMANKTIRDQFSYIVACCHGYVEDQKLAPQAKLPQKGYTSFKQQGAAHPAREQKRWPTAHEYHEKLRLKAVALGIEIHDLSFGELELAVQQAQAAAEEKRTSAPLEALRQELAAWEDAPRKLKPLAIERLHSPAVQTMFKLRERKMEEIRRQIAHLESGEK